MAAAGGWWKPRCARDRERGSTHTPCRVPLSCPTPAPQGCTFHSNSSASHPASRWGRPLPHLASDSASSVAASMQAAGRRARIAQHEVRAATLQAILDSICRDRPSDGRPADAEAGAEAGQDAAAAAAAANAVACVAPRAAVHGDGGAGAGGLEARACCNGDDGGGKAPCVGKCAPGSGGGGADAVVGVAVAGGGATPKVVASPATGGAPAVEPGLDALLGLLRSGVGPAAGAGADRTSGAAGTAAPPGPVLQLSAEGEDGVVYERLGVATRALAALVEEGAAALTHLQMAVINVACDDPGRAAVPCRGAGALGTGERAVVHASC